ncbi:MAG: DUF1566 domain-containing protein [Burkholderiaceae bacterium]
MTLSGYFLSALGLTALLAGCMDLRSTPTCGQHIAAGDLGRFKTPSDAVAIDSRTGLTWFRCSGGQSPLAGACMGAPLKLSWQEAKAYAVEFSAASGRTWRLPTYSEMKDISESDCQNPAYNQNVFPGLPIETYWTSSTQIATTTQACIVFTYTGLGKCRAFQAEPHHFMLVSDPS